MNDMVLDELLTRWKTERAPRSDSFTSPEYFEACFFARANAEKPKRTPKKKSLMEDLKKLLLPKEKWERFVVIRLLCCRSVVIIWQIIGGIGWTWGARLQSIP